MNKYHNNLANYQKIKTRNLKGILHPELANFCHPKKYKKLLNLDLGINLRKFKRNYVFDIKFPRETMSQIHSITVKKSKFNFFRQLESLVKKSKAKRAYLAAEKLLKANLNTPIPLGFLEYKRGPFVLECDYICITNADSIKLKHYFNAITTPEIKHKIVKHVGQFCRIMHDSGIKHRDLHLSNFIINPSSTIPDIALIDLSRCRFKTKLSIFQRMVDLSRLHWHEHTALFVESYSQNDNNLKKYWYLCSLSFKLRKLKKNIKKKLRHLFKKK